MLSGVKMFSMTFVFYRPELNAKQGARGTEV